MVKQSERKEIFWRILIAIVSGIILNVWKILIMILGAVNWISTLFTNKRNKNIAEFSEYFNTEIYRYAKYLTMVTNERPFPFSDLKKISKFEK